MLFRAFTRTLRQLPDPGFRRVLWLSVGLTATAFIGLTVLVGWLLPKLDVFEADWLDILLQVAGFAAWLVTLFLLFPAIATLVMSQFLDPVAEAVERRFYPLEPPGRSPSLAGSLAVSARFTAVLLLLNLLALPVYLVLLWFPPFNIILFYTLNGYLLGREYAELVGLRYLDAKGVRAWRRRYAAPLWLAGALIAFVMTIPLINLIGPIFATAFMVNVYKSIGSRGRR